MHQFRIRQRLPSTALGLSLLSAFPASALAQDQLDPIVVIGTRAPKPLSRSTGDVVVIESAAIRNSSADSVEDLLRREAGVQIVRNGPPGQNSGFFIRGASTNSTVVMVDGLRIGSASLGQAEFEALSLAQIDRIEILRGPASSLYGADAVGGVVQIYTRRGQGGLHVTGSAAVGGYGSRAGDLGVSGSQGRFDYAATVGRESSEGTTAIRPNDAFGSYNPDRDGYSRNFGNVRLGVTPVEGHRIGINVIETRLRSHYDSADFNPPDFAPDPSPDFRSHLKTSVAALDYRGEISQLWTTALQASNNIDDSKSGGSTLARFKTDRDQVTWQNTLHVGSAQQVVLAYEYLGEKVSGDAFPDRRKRDNNAVVGGWSGTFGGFSADASARHDDNSVYGNNDTGSIGLAYQIVPGLKVRAMAGTTFRAPTFNDLYYPFYGVETVQPEKGRSVEVGVAWQAGGSSVSLTAYRNRVKNLIGYNPDPEGTECPAGFFGCADNTARARLQGLTLDVGQRWGGLAIRATADLLDATDRDTGVRLARRAAHQETVSADYTQGAWSAGVSVLDIGSRPDGGARLGGYALVDVRAAWAFLPQWRLEAKVLNALDHRNEPVRDYRGLGRQGWIGIRFDGKGV